MSLRYWIDRQTRTVLQGEKRTLQYERGMRNVYEQAISDIKKEVSAFYQKYADDNEIAINTSKRRLGANELKDYRLANQTYQDEVAAVLSKHPNNLAGLSPYLKELKLKSGRAYISRMDEFKDNIQHRVNMLNAGIDVGMGKHLEFEYEASMYKTLFDISSFKGTTIDFNQPSTHQLKTAVMAKWNGANYSDRIWANKDKLLQKMDTLIPQAFVRGLSSSKLAKELGEAMEVSYSNAVRLVRTEGRYIGNKGSKDAYVASGVVDQIMFVATLDGRTSPICQSMDGKIMDLSDGEPGLTMPPLHPYCRSTTIPYFPDDEIGSILDDRVERKGGKTVRMEKYQNFRDWAKDNTDPAFLKRMQHKDPSMAKLPVEVPKQGTDPDYRDINYDEVFAEIMENDPDYEGLGGLTLQRLYESIDMMENNYIKGINQKVHVSHAVKDRLFMPVSDSIQARMDKLISGNEPGKDPAPYIAIVKQLYYQQYSLDKRAQETDYKMFGEGFDYNVRGWQRDRAAGKAALLNYFADNKDKIRQATQEYYILANKDLRNLADYVRNSQNQGGGNVGEDRLMKAYAEKRDISKPTQVVSTAEFEDLVNKKGWVPLYRGVGGKQFVQDFKTGTNYYGKGIYGNGIYTALNPEEALSYGINRPENMVSMALKPSAKIIRLDDLKLMLKHVEDEVQNMLYMPDYKDSAPLDFHDYLPSEISRTADRNLREKAIESTLEYGRLALTLGYDAIYETSNHYIILLHRNAAVIAEDNLAR